MGSEEFQVVSYPGPWLGMEEREPAQTDGHAELAVNLTLNRGLLEPRIGTRLLSTGLIIAGQVFVSERPSGPPRILVFGASLTSVLLQIFALDGTIINTVDLVATFGEMLDPRARCSFVRAITGIVPPLNGHFSVLIVTRSTTYIWDPAVDETTVRRVADTDQFKTDAFTFFYHTKSSIRGPLAEWHQNRIYYAGFQPDSVGDLDGTLPPIQGQVPETWLLAGRDSIRLGPDILLFTDTNYPFDLHATSAMRVPPNERIRGLRSFKEQLVILTDKGIHLLVGDPGFYASAGMSQFVPVVKGAGCVAPWSLVEAQNALYYLGADGFYRFDGQQSVRVSDPIGSLWTGKRGSDQLPPVIDTLLREILGWPWRVDGPTAPMTVGVLRRSEGQIWWSLPLVGQVTTTTTCRLGVVYDLTVGEQGAWTVFIRRNGEDWFSGADGLVEDGRERTFLWSSNGLYEVGGVTDDGDAVPVVYMSTRHSRGNEQQTVWRHPRLKMQAWGKTPNENPPVVFLEGEEAAFDSELGGLPVTEPNRQSWSGVVEMHPHQDNHYFLGTGTANGTMATTPRTWFSQRIDPGAVESKWFRLGFLDDAVDPDTRPPILVVQGYSMESVPTEARH